MYPNLNLFVVISNVDTCHTHIHINIKIFLSICDLRTLAMLWLSFQVNFVHKKMLKL